MYGFTLKFLGTLRVLGVKKTAVRAALLLSSFNNFEVADAADTYLYSERSGFSKCTECFLPIMSDKDKGHQSCREYIQYVNDQADTAWHEYAAERQREIDLDALDILMDSFCTGPGCYDEGANYDGKCDKHTDKYDDSDALQRESLDNPDNDPCQGECGQTVHTCTCAEYASLRRHNADPETRGSWWTA